MGERGSRLRRFEGKRKKIYKVSLKKHSSEVSGSGLFWKIREGTVLDYYDQKSNAQC